MKIGIIGAGEINDIYIKNLTTWKTNIEVVGISSLHNEHAKIKAEQYHIKFMTYEEMMNNSSIELVVSLTPVTAHYQILKDALNHNKHIYTEKVLCSSLEEALEIQELAKQNKLRVGVAPDTFLGAGIQTAKKALEEGLIGEVTSVDAIVNRCASFSYAPNRFNTQKGGGIGFNIGIYFLNAILYLLGPVAKTSGFILKAGEQANSNPNSPYYNQKMFIDNEDLMVGSILFDSGVCGNLHFNGRSIYPEVPVITIMGTKGILYLPDPNKFGGSVKYTLFGTRRDLPVEFKELELVNEYTDNSRGLGVVDMVDSILNNKPHQASIERAIHAIEVLSLIEKSSDTGLTQTLTTKI